MALSINQNTRGLAYGGALPDFRNLGIMLRILLGVNALALLAVLVKMPAWGAFTAQLMETAALVEPLLILVLATLYIVNPWFARLPFAPGLALVLALVLALTTLLHVSLAGHLPMELAPLSRYWALTALTVVLVLSYFALRARALSPALTEARLQALQARIRPHFLFNSINAVLSLIRQEPRRAESALEDMAELFRVLMADNRELIPLARELELCRLYLALEQLRLGERLTVEWRVDNAPLAVLIPPLVLQPLLENAVYHGIEPRTEPGVISIDVYAARDSLHALLRNPYQPGNDHHQGNHMALANIRERLQLHFDAEASMTSRVTDSRYEVHIVMPLRKGAA
jgi:two-component system sensor histidine kinase AlgZ